MIKLQECLPTPLSECPESIKAALEDPDKSFTHNEKYLRIKTEFSFLLRRLWTYSMLNEKSLVYVYTTKNSTNFIGIKIENEKEYIGEINLPFALNYEEIEEGMDIIADQFNGVYCLKLIRCMNF